MRLAAGAVRRRAVGLAAGSWRSAPSHGRDEVLVRLEDLEAAARREVPGPNRLVVRRREEELARRVEDERSDPVIVCERQAASAPEQRAREREREQGRTADERLEALTADGVPQLDRLVARARRGERADRLGLGRPCARSLRARVPVSDALLRTGRGEKGDAP